MPLIYKRFFALLLMLAGAVAMAQNAPPAAPAASLVGCASPGPVAAPPAAPPRGVSLDRVVAVVNDGIVLQSSLDRQVQVVSERLQQAGQQMPPRDILRQQVLERLIVQEIQMQRAARLGIKVSDEQLNETLTDVAQRNNVRFSDLPAALEQQGIDYRAYREEMRREMSARAAAPARRLLRASTSRRASWSSASPRRNRRRRTRRSTRSRTSWSPCRVRRRREQIEERTARAQGVHERAAARRGLRRPRGRVFRWRDRARGRQARLAQGEPAAVDRGRTRARHEAGRSHRGDPHAERIQHLQAGGGPRSRAGGAPGAGARAAHPDADHRRRGRGDRAPEALPHPRARAQGRGLRRHRVGFLGRQGLGRRSGGDLGWASPTSFVPEFAQRTWTRCRSTRSASRSRRQYRLAHRAAAGPARLTTRRPT